MPLYMVENTIDMKVNLPYNESWNNITNLSHYAGVETIL
jgi:hypothetical protein